MGVPFGKRNLMQKAYMSDVVSRMFAMKFILIFIYIMRRELSNTALFILKLGLTINT